MSGTWASCTALAPGVAVTGFLPVAGQEPMSYERRVMMRSATAVRRGLEAMLRRRPTAWCKRWLPHRWSDAIASPEAEKVTR